MTRGPVLRQMAVFGFPVLLGMLCQRIYNFADTYIVGRFLGDQALAAVSISGSAMYMMFSIMMGVTTGVSVVISQFYGAGEEKKIQETFTAGAHVSLWVAVLVTLLGVWTARPLLGLLQTSEELMPQAYTYLVVIYLGCGATMLYNFASAVLRALGNSVVPLMFLILSSILNVVLDVAFVSWIPMGVAGAAFATVLSQLVSGVLCLGYALRILPVLRVPREKMEAGRISGGTGAALRTAHGASDEHHLHFRYDAAGGDQHLRNGHDCGVRRLHEGGRPWFSACGRHRFFHGYLCRTKRGGGKSAKGEKRREQRLSSESHLLRDFLPGGIFPGGTDYAGFHRDSGGNPLRSGIHADFYPVLPGGRRSGGVS